MDGSYESFDEQDNGTEQNTGMEPNTGLNREYPYQDFYGAGGGGRRPKKHHTWILVLAVLLIAAGAVGLFVSRYRVELRQTDAGYFLEVRDRTAPDLRPGMNHPAEGAQSGTSQTSQQSGPPAGATGTGATLNVVSAPSSSASAETSVQTGTQTGSALTLQEIYKKVIPSVVSITSTTASGSASGTGIVMSADGYLITNDHVISGAVSIQVLTSDNKTYAAALVGSDETSDLAVLKIDASGLTPAEFGDSDQMEVGDEVVAIGDPLGAELRGTMTDGIISAINRDLSVEGRSMTLIQTNAALNNGNSGGPLINAYGQVIGINTMKMSSYYTTATVEGLGFAIPISTAKPIVDELIAKGYVSGRPAIGISGESLPRAVQVYYRLPNGIYVNSVSEKSDAYAKGITAGDIIIAVNGTAVNSMDELNTVKNQFSAGDSVTLTVYRSGQTFDVEVKLMDQAGQ